MFSKIKVKTVTIFKAITNSIAFYPTIISVGLFFFAFLLLYLETDKVTKFLLEHASFLVINNSETARSILSTLIGGILSLTVFSFSMVMILLNQASSNFSPRLLPGLISNKRNQIVLGVYLGTISYNIVVLISILPSGDKYTLNGFSILFGIALGFLSLALFVFFIHSISTAIQIGNILKDIFKNTKKRLNALSDSEWNKKIDFPNITSDWSVIRSTKAGYFYGVNLEGLKDFAQKNETNIKIAVSKDEYLLPNMPLVYLEKKLENEKDVISLLNLYAGTRDASENFALGIRQITEVGIKAMSPAINDPGTANMSIDYLTELFALRMEISDREIYYTEDENYKIELETVNFSELIYRSLAAYRQYCKHDILIMEKLAKMLKYLLNHPCENERYADTIKKQLHILYEDCQTNIENKSDIERLEKIFEGVV